MTSGSPLVLVTGPTGTVGAPLVDALVERGVPVVAGMHEPATVDGPATSRTLDFERPETFGAALSGVRRVFLMRPPAISDTKRCIRPFIRAAEQQGVEHVVFLSLMGVNRVMPHWRVEQDLRASSMGWTFLRPSFFAQNLRTAYGNDIRDRSQIRVPAGRGRTSFIDIRDVAALAALVLQEPASHAGQAYTLTGPQALGYEHVAAMLSDELGRTISYASPRLATYRRELKRSGLPKDYVNVQLLINVIARLGLAAKVTGAVAQLLGRPPTSLATYLHDDRDAWLPAGGRGAL